MKALGVLLVVINLSGLLILGFNWSSKRSEHIKEPITAVGICERFGMQANNISCKVYPSGQQECTYECWPRGNEL